MPITPSPMEVPKVDGEANLEELHQWSLEMYTWFQTVLLNGLQVPFYNTTQLADMETESNNNNDLSQTGKLFYDSEANLLKIALIEGGILKIKTISTLP